MGDEPEVSLRLHGRVVAFHRASEHVAATIVYLQEDEKGRLRLARPGLSSPSSAVAMAQAAQGYLCANSASPLNAAASGWRRSEAAIRTPWPNGDGPEARPQPRRVPLPPER